jgi:hypothetical protein
MRGFVLPGFNENLALNGGLINLMEKHPEYFYDDIKIDAVFGTFHFCAWNGGRIFERYERSFKEDIVRVKNFYESKKIPIRLTFTNTLITPELLSDPYCNMIMYELQNDLNEVLVASNVLEEYIRTNYPKYKVCSSTTKCITSPQKAKEELNNNYFQVCLDYNLNKNFKFLDSLSQEEKNRTELLCNAICPSGCKTRAEHYRLNSISILNVSSPYTLDCQIKKGPMDPTTCAYPNNISPEEITEIYMPKGFSHFKLEGRTISTSEMIHGYVRYLIKPEYHLLGSNELYKEYFDFILP